MRNCIIILILTISCNFNIVAQNDSAEQKTPFEGMEINWINGQNRQQEFPLTLKKGSEIVITGFAYLDSYYNFNFAKPIDNTQTISATIGRHNEVALNLASIGFETSYNNILARVFVQYGQMLAIVQDQDASVFRGRNTGINNLKFIREAAAGYHFNKWKGINVEMGIFSSFIGLESYLTQENWNYQRSMVSDFTPFYFTGARVQLFPTTKLKTELWILNGWQSYNSFSNSPGLGSSTLWRPNENLQLVANFYTGKDTNNPDTLGNQSQRIRFHHDNCIVARYYKKPESTAISQAAFCINSHYGFQSNNEAKDEVKFSENFMLGTSFSNRLWFNKNKLALTLRGDYLTNQSVENGNNKSPYMAFLPAEPGNKTNNYDVAIANNEKLKLFQFTSTFDVMPNDNLTFRFEYCYRSSSIPYFLGSGGTTSPSAWINGPSTINPWSADLKKDENRITISVNFRM